MVIGIFVLLIRKVQVHCPVGFLLDFRIRSFLQLSPPPLAALCVLTFFCFYSYISVPFLALETTAAVAAFDIIMHNVYLI